MKNLGWIGLVAVASLIPIGTHAQSVPTVPNYTVMGGFTTVRNRFDYGPPGSAAPGPAFYVSGWEASIERELGLGFGIVADFSQQGDERCQVPF